MKPTNSFLPKIGERPGYPPESQDTRVDIPLEKGIILCDLKCNVTQGLVYRTSLGPRL